ncbi:MAG: lamin tail domain-containing protein [Bacteroidota bacterium]
MNSQFLRACILLVSGMLCSMAGLKAQTTLYSEDFSGQLLQGFTGPVAGGATFTSVNGKWSVTADPTQGIFDANDHARVEDDVVGFNSTTLPTGAAFQFRDVDEPTTWRSQVIDISNYTSANLGVDIFEIGSLETTDFTEVAYILDGVRTVILTLTDDYSDADGTGSSSSSDPGNTSPIVLRPTATGLSGSTLQIEVVVDVNSSSELPHIDNVLVEGFGFTAPACSFQFGANSAVCDATTQGTDTYTATFNFSGAGNGDYTVTASTGTVVLDNDPDTDASGSFRVTGVAEGTDVTATVNGVSCVNVTSTATSPTCAPVVDIVINEIHYNGALSGTDFDEFIEILNNGPSTVDLSGWSFTQGFAFTFPNGSSIAPGEFQVIALDAAFFTSQYGFAPDYEWTSGGLSNSGEDIIIVDGDGNVQDVVDYDDGGGWPTEPDGNGPSLELIDPDLDNNLPASWTASIVSGGSPGAANGTGCPLTITIGEPSCESETLGTDTYTVSVDFDNATPGSDTYTLTPNAGNVAASSDDPNTVATGTIVYENIPEGTELNFSLTSTNGCNALVRVTSPVCEPQIPLVITEIMYNPLEGGQDTTEYIEVFNNSGSDVDASGFTFSGVTFTFPANSIIGAGEYVVIAGNASGFENFYGCAPDYEWTTGGLSNSGELVLINSGSGAEVDRVDFDDNNGWPTEPDGDGPSLELIDINGDNDDPSNWEASLGFGTPGAANTGSISDCPPAAPVLVVNGDLLLFPDLTWTESRFADSYTIQRSTGGAFTTITTVSAGTTTFTDTLLVFGVATTYQVVANNVNGSTPSNTDGTTQPAVVQPLSLTFDCYNVNTDELVWNVNNPNAIGVPYIYAQWFSAQRDTVIGTPGLTEFRTNNNPQVTSGFDDNITGIWWIDERLLPGEPNDIVFTIDLSNTCALGRPAAPAAVPTADGLFNGPAFSFLTTNVDLEMVQGALTVGPNPFQNSIFVQSDLITGSADLTLMDMTGRIVLQTKANLAQRTEIVVGDLTRGVYMLQVKSDKYQETIRLIKE